MSHHSDEIAYLPAHELVARYRTRELSPVEVTAALLERTEQLNPSLNAIVTVTAEGARAQAREAEAAYREGRADGRPLLGVPFTVKDNIPVQGVRTTMGSLLSADAVPDTSAPTVERSLAAGGVLLGKSNTPEYGWKGETTNRVFGSTYNPWNLELTPGGSTGGGAAAVAAGLGPLALGTDGGGSIRIPAAFSGLFGYKASFGVIPVVPNGSLETLPHVGVLARTVRDGALYAGVVAGPDARDRLSLNDSGLDFEGCLDRGVEGFRIAWSPDLGYAAVEPEILAIVAPAARALAEAGAVVEEVELDFEDPYPIFDVLFSAAMGGPHAKNFEEVRHLIDFGRVAVVEAALRMTAADVGHALIQRWRWYEQMRRLMERYDLLLTPTLPLTAFKAGLDRPETVAGRPVEGLSWSPFTYPLNLTGQPACSVPAGLTRAGLPVGLQIVGGWRGDEAVLRAAAAFEAVRPWQQLRPPLDGVSAPA